MVYLKIIVIMIVIVIVWLLQLATELPGDQLELSKSLWTLRQNDINEIKAMLHIKEN